MNCLPDFSVGFGGVMLAFGVVVALWVLWKIQRSPKPVDFVDLLLDESGRASWTRMCAIGVFLFSTWVIAHRELSGTLDAKSASVQVLILPTLIFLWGIATVTIAAIVRG